MKSLQFAIDGIVGGKLVWDSPHEHYWWDLVRAIRDHANAAIRIFDAMEEE